MFLWDKYYNRMCKTSKSILSLLLLLVCLRAQGQETAPFYKSSRNDISAGYGWVIPIVKGNYGSNGTVVRLDYKHFFKNNAGFGVGVQHIGDYMDVDGNIGVPISFVCRTDMHDYRETFGKGVKYAINNDSFADYDPYYGREYEHPVAQGIMSDIGAFLVGLVNRAEFRAGLTPGYIYGEGKKSYTSYKVQGVGDQIGWSGVTGTEVGSRFCLSADAGVTLSYRIWHFCLSLNPELHYIMTDSYRLYSKPDGGTAETRPQRWQVSMMFSLNLML